MASPEKRAPSSSKKNDTDPRECPGVAMTQIVFPSSQVIRSPSATPGRRTLPPVPFEQVGEGALAVLLFDVLHPAPVGRVDGDRSRGDLPERCAPPDMVGMGVGQEDQGDLLRRPPQSLYVVEYQGCRCGDAGSIRQIVFPTIKYE